MGEMTEWDEFLAALSGPPRVINGVETGAIGFDNFQIARNRSHQRGLIEGLERGLRAVETMKGVLDLIGERSDIENLSQIAAAIQSEIDKVKGEAMGDLTHYPGCYREAGHENCAVSQADTLAREVTRLCSEIDRLTKEAAQSHEDACAEVEDNVQLRQELSDARDEVDRLTAELAEAQDLAAKRRTELERHSEDRARLRKELAEAREAMPDPDKLETLALWFDVKNPNDPDPEVQTDLRRWATRARAFLDNGG